MRWLTETEVLEMGELGFNALKQFRRLIAKYIYSPHSNLAETVQKELTTIGVAYAVAKFNKRNNNSLLLKEKILARKEAINTLINLNRMSEQLPELQARIAVIIGYLKKII